MRIAVLTETFHPFRGGSAKRYLEVLSRLVRKGYEVDLYTVRLRDEWPEYESYMGINIFRTREALRDFITRDGFRSIRAVLKYVKWIYGMIMGERYDLIEANHCPIFPMYSGYLKALRDNIPLVGTFHEVWHRNWYWYVRNMIYVPLGIMMEKLYIHLPDRIVAVSNMVRDRLIRLLNVDGNIVTVIRNGVDIDMFNGVGSDGVDDSRVIYLGRLNPHKRVDWLLKAFKILSRRMPGARLEIVGDGPYRGVYEAIARRLNLDGRVVFHGSIGEVEKIRLLKSSRVYVLPSIREGQSITTLEAMAAGTPQIVIDIDGNGAVELLRESRSGLIVKPSIRSIAEAILSIMANDELYERLRINGLRYARMNTWDNVADKYNLLYRGLLS